MISRNSRKPLSQSQVEARKGELFNLDLSKVEERVIQHDVKFGPELLDEVIKEPTLNIYLDRSPKLNTPKDHLEMVTILQHKRAAFITAEQKKKEPKIEGEE